MKNYKISFQNKLLSVNTDENKDKNSIIFVHGNSMSSKIWQRQYVQPLTEQYQLISFDIPGHGESENLDSYSFSLLADSIVAVINYFKPTKYVVIGNSLGGDLLLQISSKLSNCKGIMLLNTPPVSKPPAMEKALQPNPLIGMLFTKDYEKGNLEPFSKIFFHDVNKIPGFIIPDFERTDGLMRQTLAETVGTLNYSDEVDLLKTLTVPVAIVAGVYEKIVNNEYYESLVVPQLWNNKVNFIENSAHCPQWENTESFNNLLDDFCINTLN